MNEARIAELLAEIFKRAAEDKENPNYELCRSLYLAAEQVAAEYNRILYPIVPCGTVDIALDVS